MLKTSSRHVLKTNKCFLGKELLLHQVSKCTKLIIEAKDEHLAELSSKLDNPNAAPKTHWSIINRFVNNKKVPILPPVFLEGKLISDFEKEAELCNNHLFFVLTISSQCPHNVLWSRMQVPYQTGGVSLVNENK